MSKNINKTVSVTNYLVGLPRTSYLLLSIFLLGILFGLIVNLDKYSGADLLTLGILDGLFVLTIPALLSALAVKLMIRKMEFKKIIATTLAGEFLYAFTYIIALLISTVSPQYSQWTIFIGSAFVFVLWYYIARIFFGVKWKAFIFAIFQLIFYAFFLMSSQLVLFKDTPLNILFKFYLSSFLLLAGIYLFIRIINAPMKRLFGYSSMDAFSMFMAQWLYDKKDIEQAFKDVGEKCRVFLSMFVFERKKDKKIFLTPYVHYGPFGNLGGSEFSYLLSKELDKKYNAQTFVFHGTVTHDLNPSSSSEIKKILDACDSCMKECKPAKSSVAFSQGMYKECTADSLLFDDSAFISVTRAPKLTEDINFGLGLSMSSIAEKYTKMASIVDQHNADTGDITSFEPGSIIGYRYMKAVEDVFSKKSKSFNLEAGFSERHPTSDVIGRAGIKVAIFSTKPMYVLVLIDSNGITPEFRKTIMDQLQKIGETQKQKWEVGVFTTDTHKVNTVKGVANPLKHDSLVLEDIKTASLEAMYDMQPCKLYSCKKWFDINVLGPKQSIELVSAVSSIIAVAKVAAPIIIFGAVLAIIWILSKL